MRDNFTPSLAAILVHEGGYVCNPHDHGGATNFGVTQKTYDDWRTSHDLPHQSVRNITRIETEAIYFNRYWTPIHGDSLPSGVDYAAFDFAFNSGPNRSARFLQRVSGVAEDGQIGKQTLAAVENIPPLLLIDRLCDERLQFLQALNTFKFFGKGWTRRVAEVRERAKVMAS